MREISLCMIVKNEEKVIGRCLDSVKELVDEIIIVDTGSTDRTKEIVANYTSNIFDFEWVDDFAKARNFSFSKATKDYILWLDADDILLEEDQAKFVKLKESLDGSVDIYQMKYNYIVDERNHPTLVQIRARLLKREKQYQWISPIHEVIIPTGRVEKVDIAITHKKEGVKDVNRNIRIFEKMKANGVELDDRQEYCYAKELYCLNRYEEAVVQYKKYIKKYEKEYQWKRSYLYPSILELADCYRVMKIEDKRLDTLFIILKHEIPGAECCCKIGEIFMERKEYHTAIFWFSLALQNRKDVKEEGDANTDYNEFIPYIHLCVCYYWVGDLEKSRQYNEMAGKIKPKDETYLFNQKVLQSR